jgi:hypothetical protein
MLPAVPIEWGQRKVLVHITELIEFVGISVFDRENCSGECLVNGRLNRAGSIRLCPDDHVDLTLNWNP